MRCFVSEAFRSRFQYFSAPGLVLTDATEGAPAEFKEFIRSMTPTQTISKPEDVANAIGFLVKDESAQITGAYLSVSGGAYLS
jgi:3-oxoacyl-[acyl-carrier protein] reductase